MLKLHGAGFMTLVLAPLFAIQSVNAQDADAPNGPAPAELSDTAPEAPEAVDTIAVNVADGTQDEPAPSDSTTPRNRVIEEIVITAQKREERLQDVPISVQAFSDEALQARGVENTNDLGQIVPSLQFSSVAGFQLIFMRGLGTDNFIPSADPSIATYVDGIYLAPGQSANNSLGNVERVEVLKGPQGTLFGRNSTGGAISIVTKEPGDVFDGSAEGEFGNFLSRSARASVSGPLTDWVSASLAGQATRRDSYYSNVNYDTIPDKTEAYRLKVNFHPIEDASLSLTVYHADQQGLGSLIGKNTEPSLLGRLLAIEPGQADDYTANSDTIAESKTAQDLFYGNLTWNLPWFDLKLLGSDQYILSDFVNIDFDGSSVPIATFDVTNEYTDLQTGELQIISNDETPGSDTFQWVAGLYYLQSTAGFDPAHLKAGANALNALFDIAANRYSVPVPTALSSAVDGLLDGLGLVNTPLGDNGLSVAFRGLLGTESYSAYAQGSYFFNEYFDLTLGGRYQEEDRFLEKAENALSNFDGSGEIRLIPFGLQSQKSRNFSPRVVLSYRPRENALLYASYSAGYKSGTYNIVNIYTPSDYIVPEKVTSYEAGVKVDFLAGRLRTNAAVFYNDIENYQSGFVSLLSGGAVAFVSVPGARTRGVEIDGTWLPLPDLDPGLVLTFNAAYVDAIFTDYPDGRGFDEETGLFADGRDASGNQITRAPKRTAGLGLVQAIEVSNGSVEMAADGYYNSGFFYDAYNTVEESAYSLLNARVSYLYDPWQLRVTGFVQNALDHRYHIAQLQTDFGITKTLAAPREFGLRFNWDF